jgi:hypothetical protein
VYTFGSAFACSYVLRAFANWSLAIMEGPHPTMRKPIRLKGRRIPVPLPVLFHVAGFMSGFLLGE